MKEEEILKGIEKGNAEILERKSQIRQYKKEIERLQGCISLEEYEIEIAKKITKKLENELKDLK